VCVSQFTLPADDVCPQMYSGYRIDDLRSDAHPGSLPCLTPQHPVITRPRAGLPWWVTLPSSS